MNPAKRGDSSYPFNMGQVSGVRGQGSADGRL